MLVIGFQVEIALVGREFLAYMFFLPLATGIDLVHDTTLELLQGNVLK